MKNEKDKAAYRIMFLGLAIPILMLIMLAYIIFEKNC